MNVKQLRCQSFWLSNWVHFPAPAAGSALLLTQILKGAHVNSSIWVLQLTCKAWTGFSALSFSLAQVWPRLQVLWAFEEWSIRWTLSFSSLCHSRTHTIFKRMDFYSRIFSVIVCSELLLWHSKLWMAVVLGSCRVQQPCTHRTEVLSSGTSLGFICVPSCRIWPVCQYNRADRSSSNQWSVLLVMDLWHGGRGDVAQVPSTDPVGFRCFDFITLLWYFQWAWEQRAVDLASVKTPT